jgi:hypothetical protein
MEVHNYATNWASVDVNRTLGNAQLAEAFARSSSAPAKLQHPFVRWSLPCCPPLMLRRLVSGLACWWAWRQEHRHWCTAARGPRVPCASRPALPWHPGRQCRGLASSSLIAGMLMWGCRLWIAGHAHQDANPSELMCCELASTRKRSVRDEHRL